MTSFVALLRGINVGGRNKLPMAELRAIAADCGFESPRTCIQSGNLVFEAHGSVEQVRAALGEGIRERMGFDVPLAVRAGADWRALVEGCPWPDAARERDRQVHLGLATSTAPSGAEAALREWADDGERVVVVGAAIWIDFAAGVARSKLTSARLDRAFSGIVTLRNHRTVLRITALLDEA